LDDDECVRVDLAVGIVSTITAMYVTVTLKNFKHVIWHLLYFLIP